MRCRMIITAMNNIARDEKMQAAFLINLKTKPINHTQLYKIKEIERTYILAEARG